MGAERGALPVRAWLGREAANEQYAGGSSVRAFDLERCRDEEVVARLHSAQVESFDGNDARLEEDVMRLFVSDGEPVDADELDAAVDQQLCRWLLLSLDRLETNELSMTQELIANMLGVRREGVTEAAGKLQDAGLIRYRRGTITVLDRPGLEARSCECYQVVKTEFDRLLPYVVR